ncbi:MAG TPA: hypothetical protein VIT45_14515, partial [Allosphingosinicella sp.]
PKAFIYKNERGRMAFVLDQTWDVAAPVRGAAAAGAPFSALDPLLSNGRDRYAWKTGAILLSILVHILILWLFLTRLAGTAGDGRHAGILHSFSLSDSSASAAAPGREVVKVPPLPPAASETSDLDASAETELVPEWSVSRLPPRPAPPNAQSSPASASTAGSTPGAAAGSGGRAGGVYDPYAGAAPLRRERGAGSQAPSLGERVLGFFGFGSRSFGGLTLDEVVLEAARRAVAGRISGRGGTADLIVRVSPTGVVLEVSMVSGSAPPDARDALARALVGKRLFQGNAADAQELALPTLRLG